MDAHTERAAGLRVVAASEDAGPLEEIGALLTALGHDVVARETALDGTVDAVLRHDAQLAVVCVHHTLGHALDLVERVSDQAPCPVVLVLDDDDPAVIRLAAERGALAYANRMSPEAVAGAIELAQHLHDEFARLGHQVSELAAGAERRGVIERAKGVLMERHDITEPQAYELLRRRARTSRTRVVDVAQAVLEARGLLGRPPPGDG